MMGEQIEDWFVWNLKNFSTLQDDCYYSQPLVFAGWKWHIIAYPKAKGCGNIEHLSLYLSLVDHESLPSGWRKEVKFSLTVVNKTWKESTKLLGQNSFDASTPSWGFKEFMPLSKLYSKDQGYLSHDTLIIVAQLYVFPPHLVKTIGPLMSKQAADASVDKAQGDPRSCQVVQETENAASQDNVDYDVSQKNPSVNTSEEGSDDDDASEEDSDDDDDGTSEESSDDDDASQEGLDDDDNDDDDDDDASEKGPDDVDASEEGLDDDDDDDDDDDNDDDGDDDDDDDSASEKGPDDEGDDNASSLVSENETWEKLSLNLSNTSNDGSLTVENRGMKCKNVASETYASNVDNDDASRESSQVDAFIHVQGDDDASSLVSGVSDRDASSLSKSKSKEDASQRVENGDTSVAYVIEASNDLLREIQPIKETVHINGFEVFSSQVESVSHIFKRHPDIALGFRPKNQEIRRAYMNELLNLIEMLCQSPEKLSEDDLSHADETLADLIDVGFKLDWLKSRVNEVSEKKKLQEGSVARIETMEEELINMTMRVLELQWVLEKEKAEALAARAPLSFNDVIF